MKIRTLEKKDIPAVIECLFEGRNILTKKDKQDVKIVKAYFKHGWKGYGYWENQILSCNAQTGKSSWSKPELIGYCFIKYPETRPETMTVVRTHYRNKGIATELRDYVISKREFEGNIVYSAVKIDNPASAKSVLKSGFHLFDLTQDGFLQFIKILPFYKETNG